MNDYIVNELYKLITFSTFGLYEDTKKEDIETLKTAISWLESEKNENAKVILTVLETITNV